MNDQEGQQGLGDYVGFDAYGQPVLLTPDGRPTYPSAPVQPSRFGGGGMQPPAQIAPGRPVPNQAIPQSLIPLIEGLRDRALLAQILEAYRSVYQAYWYGEEAVALLNNQTGLRRPITLHPDSYFVASQLVMRSDDTNANFTVKIEDSTKSITLMNAPIHFSLLTGDGNRPYYLAREHVFGPKSTVTIEFSDRATGATHNIDWFLVGYKVYVREP